MLGVSRAGLLDILDRATSEGGRGQGITVATPQLPRSRALNTTGSRDLAKKYIALLALVACTPLELKSFYFI